MSSVVELLERKRTLLERMQEHSDPQQLAEIEYDLKEINKELNQLEAATLDAPPTAPY